MSSHMLNHYLAFGPFTNPGCYEGYLRSKLPSSIPEIGKLVRSQIIHKMVLRNGNTGSNADLRYGDMTKVPWHRQCEDDLFPTAASMLAELFRRDALGLTLQREEKNRLVVTCRFTAIRVASIGYPCCPLWGAQLHDGQLKYLLQKYNKFVILLDNDNNQVKTKQRRIRDRLEAHGATVSLCLLDKDPKHYSDEELIKVLHDS